MHIGDAGNKSCHSSNNKNYYDDGKNIQLKAYKRGKLFEKLQLQTKRSIERTNQIELSQAKMELMFTQITIATNENAHKHKKDI